MRTFLLTGMSLLCLNAFLNVALDADGQFRTSGLVIHRIQGGESYQKIQGLDSFLERNGDRPVGIVLGSSRVMMLDPGANEATIEFYNCGISGGKAEDILAFTRYLLDHRTTSLREAIIGVDPFALAVPNDPSDYGARLRGVYVLAVRMSDRLGLRRRVDWSLAALLGRDWTTALRELRDPQVPRLFNDRGLFPESNYVRRIGTDSAGRRRYLAQHIRMVLEHLPQMPTPDPQRVRDLEEAVHRLRARGARVVLFLPPTHPTLLAALRSEPTYTTALAAVRAVLGRIAEQSGARFVDLTDPEVAGLGAEDFWDGYHYTSAAAKKVAQRLRSPAMDPHSPNRWADSVATRSVTRRRNPATLP